MKITEKQKIIIGSALIIAVGGAAAFAFIPRKATPPPPENKAAAAKFIASQDFAAMPVNERAEYLKKGGRSLMAQTRQMSDAERKAFRENAGKVRMAEMAQRMDRFFSLSEAEQNARLDEDIANMKKRMAEAQSRRQNQANAAKSQQNQPRPQRTPPSAQERRERDASMNPATRAKMQVYFEKLRQRAAATGQTLPRPGGRPGR